MQYAIEYAAIPNINLTPLFLVTNPPHQFFTVSQPPSKIPPFSLFCDIVAVTWKRMVMIKFVRKL